VEAFAAVDTGGVPLFRHTEEKMNLTINSLHPALSFAVLIRVFPLCFSAYCALTASPVSAQPYPNKPIRMIVPQAVGSPGDYWARLIAAKSPEVFGQNLIVDNRPGANGFIGAEAAARAPADGYTLLMTNSITHVYNPWLYR
jgi:tripartite-type tricarboxylate transporter receptor subunit TctC